MSRDPRTPVSVARIGRVTVRIYDEQAYQTNIRRYYAGDAATSAPNLGTSLKFETSRTFAKKKACYDWASWRGGPMINAV